MGTTALVALRDQYSAGATLPGTPIGPIADALVAPGNAVGDRFVNLFNITRIGGRAPVSNGVNDTEAVQAFLDDRSFGIKDFGGQEYLINGWGPTDPRRLSTWVLSKPPHVREIGDVTFRLPAPLTRRKSLLDVRNALIGGNLNFAVSAPPLATQWATFPYRFAEDAVYPTDVIKLASGTGIGPGSVLFLKATNSFGMLSSADPKLDDNPKLGETVKVIEALGDGRFKLSQPLLASYLLGNLAYANVFAGSTAIPAGYTGPFGPVLADGLVRMPINSGFKLEDIRTEGPGMYGSFTEVVNGITVFRETDEKFLQLLYAVDATIADCSWKDLNNVGIAAQTCFGIRSVDCRGERTAKYGHVITAGSTDVIVSMYTSVREFAAAETGGGGTGINRGIVYKDMHVFNPIAVGANAKYATADVTMDTVKVFGDLGKSFDNLGENHQVTGLRSRAAVTRIRGCEASHVGRGIEAELQAAGYGGTPVFDIQANILDGCFDFGMVLLNADTLPPGIGFGGSVLGNHILNQKSYVDDASTIPSAAILVQSLFAPVEKTLLDANRVANCEAHALVVIKAGAGAISRLAFGPGNILDLAPAAQLPAPAAQTVTLDPATGLLTTPGPHLLAAGQYVSLATTGYLPTKGLRPGASFRVLPDGLSQTTLRVAQTVGGAPIDVTGPASGTAYLATTPPQPVTFDSTFNVIRTGPTRAVTADIDSNLFTTEIENNYPAGLPVFFTTASGGVLPSPLVPNEVYRIAAGGLGAAVFKVERNGAVVNLTTPGSGTFSVTPTHDLSPNAIVTFTTTGFLPTTGLRPAKNYRVSLSDVPDAQKATSIRLEDSGAPIAIEGTQSGTVTMTCAGPRKKVFSNGTYPDGNTAFTLPFLETVAAGTLKAVRSFDRDVCLTGAKARLRVAQAAGATKLTINVKVGGVTMFTGSGKLTFENGAVVANLPTLSPTLDRNVPAGTPISFDIDGIGDGTAAGLDVAVLGFVT